MYALRYNHLILIPSGLYVLQLGRVVGKIALAQEVQQRVPLQPGQWDSFHFGFTFGASASCHFGGCAQIYFLPSRSNTFLEIFGKCSKVVEEVVGCRRWVTQLSIVSSKHLMKRWFLQISNFHWQKGFNFGTILPKYVFDKMYPTFCNSARWWEVQSRKWQWVHWLSSPQWAAVRGVGGMRWFVGWLKRSPLSRHGCSFSSIMPGQEISRVEARQKLRPELYLEERVSDIKCFFWVVPVIGVTGVRQFLQRSKYVTDNPYKLTARWLRAHFYRMIRCQMYAEGILI